MCKPDRIEKKVSQPVDEEVQILDEEIQRWEKGSRVTSVILLLMFLAFLCFVLILVGIISVGGG